MENTLDAFQKAVGGYIEELHVGPRLLLFVNEDGAHDPLGSFNGHSLTGVAVLVRSDAEGETIDVTDDDIALTISKFRPAKMN
jgi:hypothetical protein